uniref:G_PROTEIN_RECEP_F1_2 domain-containing protein n=1 Tax=Parastrongyloides trichosuri TaxID=131310 RepID=A0A0N4ZCD1_PARTI
MLNIHILLNGYLTTIFVFMGVILNIISIVVLGTSFKKNSNNSKRLSSITTHDNSVMASNSLRKSSSSDKLYETPSQQISKLSKTTSAYIPIQHNISSTTIYPIIVTCVTRPKIYIYFTWITICDTALLIFAFLMYGAPTIGNQEYGNFYAPWTPLTYTFCNTTMVASVWLMCALMYDRYRALSSKLTVALSLKSIREKDIHKMLAFVSLTALLYTLPRFFELKVIYEEIEINSTLYDDIKDEVIDKKVVPIPVQTDLVRNNFYMIGYRVIGGLLFYSLIPYILLFGASTKISIDLHKSAKKRQRMFSMTSMRQSVSSSTSESNKILIAVMAKFLISRLMPTILDVAECLLGTDSFNNDYFYAPLFIDISNFIIVVASTTNFFIFHYYSKIFKGALYKQSNDKKCSLKICGQMQQMNIYQNISERT